MQPGLRAVDIGVRQPDEPVGREARLGGEDLAVGRVRIVEERSTRWAAPA
jgi:hypothetical protein